MTIARQKRVWTHNIYSDTSVTLPGVCIRIKTWMPRYPGPGQAGLTKGEQGPYWRHLSDRIDSVGTGITFILYWMMFKNVDSWDLVLGRSH